jgi:hypothetical protein
MPVMGDGEEVVSGWRRWIRKPAVWIGTALLAGLAVALSGLAQRTVESIPDRIHGPLEYAVTTDYGQFQAAFLGVPKYVIPLPPDEIDTPPGWDEGLQARQRWAEELGGVTADATWVQIDIRGRSSRPVLLTDLRINMIERLAPAEGTVVDYGEFGDVIPERYLSFSLIEDPPRLTGSYDDRYLHGAIPESEAEPIDFPYQVSATEPELFYVLGHTYPYKPELENVEGCECVWTIELSYSDGARTGTITIDDNGEPFRTTTRPEGAPYAASYNGEPLSVQTSGGTAGD